MARRERTETPALPPLLDGYLGFPYRVGIWVAAVAFLAFAGLSLTPRTFEPAAGRVAEEPSFSLSVTGPYEISLAKTSSGISASWSSQRGAVIRRESIDRVVASDEGGVFAALTVTASDEGARREVTGTRGGFYFRYKDDDDGFKILDTAGAVVGRVKVKEDKFNVYDGGGRRVVYGKEKKGALLVRDDSGRDLGWIRSSHSLTLWEASYLCLPIPEEARALLFLEAAGLIDS